jgi:hypothetical protein
MESLNAGCSVPGASSLKKRQFESKEVVSRPGVGIVAAGAARAMSKRKNAITGGVVFLMGRREG